MFFFVTNRHKRCDLAHKFQNHGAITIIIKKYSHIFDQSYLTGYY